ncbi:uncharacterized protein [Hoplias malabaricus]|uniref:uncharacterized protein n=1 Tax=Hoplias malabaricus TaxID=27720 RepID=UPI0034625E03
MRYLRLPISFGITHWTLWISTWHLFYSSGESPCKSELILSLNVTTVLQSDVLLPCNFSPGLIGLNTTADIAAVWSHRNMTVDNLVEITLQGQTMYWKNYNRQIKTFSSVSASGNFSILLRNVTQSDEGLYQCDLFNGTGCRIAYQDIFLNILQQSVFQSALAYYWSIIAGGGTATLILLLVSFFCVKLLCKKAPNEIVYENTVYKRRNDINLNQVQSNRNSSVSKPGVNDKKMKDYSNIYANKPSAGAGNYVSQVH